MKRLLCLVFLLTLAVLMAGCSGNSPADTKPEILTSTEKEPVSSLPETSAAKPVSAQAVVTEGRMPAQVYDLPPSLAAAEENPWYDMDRWLSGGRVELLAETVGSAFYGLPYSEDAHETALIRWGDSLAEFDWNFVTTRRFLPRMACFDIDGDQEEELIVLCYTGGGTGISIYELHVLEKNPNGGLTDYAMPENLWGEQASELLGLDEINGRFFLSLGREFVEIVPSDAQITEGKEGPSTGWIADFRLLPEDNVVLLQGAVDLWHLTNYVASYTANVQYVDGMFTLTNFHLYSAE